MEDVPEGPKEKRGKGSITTITKETDAGGAGQARCAGYQNKLALGGTSFTRILTGKYTHRTVNRNGNA